MVLFAATAGMAGSFVACSDSYRNDTSGSGTGPGGPGGGGEGGTSGTGSTGALGEGGLCEYTCSNDLKRVISCNGATIQECGPEEGCLNAACVPGPCTAADESKSSYGCDFWALKTAQRSQAQGACFAAFIANTWEKNVKIGVERNGTALPVESFAFIPQGQGANVTYEPYNPEEGLGVGQVAVLFLSRRSGGLLECPREPAVRSETGVLGTGRGSAFHITTDYPVVAYQIVPYGGGQTSYTSATLLLPTSSWDTNYLAVNAYPVSELNPDGMPALEIVAREDDTSVTILPKAAIEGAGPPDAPIVAPAAAGTPVTYTLGKGEFLQIAQSAELTGSPILSDKPIGVFGASSCMNVPLETADCDSAHQQIAPIRATGNEYAAIRYEGRMGGADEAPPWRLVGMVDGTELTWAPSKPEGAPSTLKLGEVVEFSAAGPFVVRSQGAGNPFYLGGYMTGGENFQREGDPEWVNIIPPSQFLNYYVLFTDPTYPQTSLNVVRTRSRVNGEFADVTLECMGKLSGWQPIGDYEYTRVQLVSGNFEGNGDCINGRHVMSSDLPFGVTVWGWGAVNGSLEVSYAYPAGAGFQPINEIEVPPVPR
ncbi:IgGFc-binding protein [Sorangium cellulosum]|uniref:IgGFc-binding protein n=1 Tax=Sorangium cellulosum TaxID=56 RepID=UPI001331B234|nr:IgGFc-binding protein [Sorangium cellulosum]